MRRRQRACQNVPIMRAEHPTTRPEQVPVAELDVRGRWPYVGRAAQLAAVRAALRSRSAKALLLCGPSGVGKSRIASEVATEAVGAGERVLRVTADSALAEIPLGALLPVLPGAALDLDSLANHPSAPFDTIRRALRDDAAGRRILLVVDDLGSLDRLSLALIAQLLAAEAVRLVATLREGEPIPDTVLSLWTDGAGVRVDVPALTLNECAELLEAVLDDPVAHRAVRDFHAASQGNPLMLRELVAGAHEAGDLESRNGIWRLSGPPQGTVALQELIRARFATLGPSDRDLVRRLAVCHTLSLEEAVGDGDPAHAARLEQQGVIALREHDGTLWLTLGHPQYGEAIRASLSRLERIGILADQARATAAISSEGSNELRIAVWNLDAGRPANAASLARAAGLASLAQDYPMMARFSAAALAVGGPDPEMLLLQGYSLWILGENEESIGVLEAARAADSADPGSTMRTVSIARALASAYAGRRFGEVDALAVLDQAVRDSPELVDTLAEQRAILFTYLERADDAAAALGPEPLRGEVGEIGPDQLSAAVVSSLTAVSQGRSAQALAIAEAAVHAAMFENEPVTTLRRARVALAMAQLWCSQLVAAEATANLGLAEAIAVDDEHTIAYAQLILADCALAQGQLRRSEQWCREVIGSVGAQHQARFHDQASSRLALALTWQGRIDEAVAVRDGFHDRLAAHNSIALLATVWVDLAAGADREIIRRLVERAEELVTRGERAVAAVLLHSVSRLGEPEAAAPLLRSIAEASDSRDIALLAEHAIAEAEQNADRLAAVGTEWQSLGSHILAAEAFTAAALHSSSRPATRLRQTAAHLRRLADDACTPMLERLGESARLTRRESEIAALARAGHSTHQIAARLTLSPRTVDNHLYAVYQKLGVAGRDEL